MRYYCARQRRVDDNWEFTIEFNGLSYPIGYCIGVPNLDSESLIEALGSKESPAYKYYRDYVISHLTSFHSFGHHSKEEACNCYRKYLLDTRLELDHVVSGPRRRCQVCNELTHMMATVDTTHYYLCDDHRTREMVERFCPPVFERWEK